MLRLSFILVTFLSKTFQAEEEDFRIFGGENCNISNHPFYIYLECNVKEVTFLCGGSLLNNDAVLTAGHCCINLTSITAYSGFIRDQNTYDQKSKGVIPPKLHPDFNRITLNNDICLIKLEKPFKLNKHTNLIKLPPKKKLEELMNNKSKNYQLLLMGYGMNSQDLDKKFIIDDKIPFQCTNSLLKPQNGCLNDLKDSKNRSIFDPKTMFCHYNPEIDRIKGSCRGDSGSPIIYNNTQVGLISWGPNEASCALMMEVSARLDVSYDWILENGIKK